MNWSKLTKLILALTICCIVFASAGSIAIAQQYNHMLVANRESGSISQINISDNSVQHFAIPTMGTQVTPEPMYITYSPDNELVYVGDRANDRLVVYNANDYTTSIREVAVGDGIFHMWGDRNKNQLWVNNDGDKSVSVVDMLTSSVITTFSTPADLNSGRPHDVFVNPNDSFAYVTMIGVDDVTSPSDWIIKYKTTDFTEVARFAVGNDPHVTYSPSSDKIYVPTQGGDGVSVIDALFDTATFIPVPNSHGAWLSRDESTLYTTNISDLGVNGLVSIDLATNTINDSVDAPFSTPHNVITTLDDTRLYLTHSGATNNQVSIYDVSNPAMPVYLSSVTTEFNPYGIALISNVPEPGHFLLLLSGLGMAALRRRRV